MLPPHPFCNNIELHNLSTSYTVKDLPGVILYGSLVYTYIFLAVVSVDETIIYPFLILNHFTVHKTFNDFFVLTGRSCGYEPSRPLLSVLSMALGLELLP